jgi:hypothetical protein
MNNVITFREYINEIKTPKNSELKKAALDFVKELRKHPQNYAYQLTKLTEWGFWAESGGEVMVSLDNNTLKKVVTELSKFIKYAPQHFLEELNDLFDFYEMNEGSIKPIYNDIMKKIEKRYKGVDFENSMGSLLVKKDGVNIGLINRKNVDKWEEIIDKKLDLISKTPKGKKIADEINVDMRGYKPGN